jgi:alkanesulfonate monooxygenase SsuD/methylene tetrahydromethanopterin reductase-like flavin-dependent oxidoreductase (luciferase family)
MNIKNRVEKIENQINETPEGTARAEELFRKLNEARKRVGKEPIKLKPGQKIICGKSHDIAAMLQAARERRIKAETQRGKGNRQSVKK